MLCGILFHHPEIVMHNELFNPIDIFTYYPHAFSGGLSGDGGDGSPQAVLQPRRWTVLTRDLFPYDFLEYIWSGKLPNGKHIRPAFKAIGFKSFPEHWTDVRNEHIWQDAILEDLRVKKIILHRRDELAVYVSMLRADETGRYMTHCYPEGLTFNIDPAAFQFFLNRYRLTFQTKYKSPIVKRDTFWICYEDLCDETYFAENVYPPLCQFLGVDPSAKMRLLRETVKQADPMEDLSKCIDNYDELEYCFRYSDVLHFAERREQQRAKLHPPSESKKCLTQMDAEEYVNATWTILLPICSRKVSIQAAARHEHTTKPTKFDTNRFSELTQSSQYGVVAEDDKGCWELLSGFCESLQSTVPASQLEHFECIVGIDVDDKVYQPAKQKLHDMIPCQVVFVDIQRDMYAKLCRIWSHLASKSNNDFIVLFGDDIRLLDVGWPQLIVRRFHNVASKTGLPFGAGCVAMNDLSFPGFPTFPVVHRWHVEHFGTLLPKQFINQGGDPYLFELYSRFGAADWEVQSRLENTIGGDGDARYPKYHINWRGHILNMNVRKLKKFTNHNRPRGTCLDIVVPSYRTANIDYLERIAMLRASRDDVYVKFWFVVDNPCKDHVSAVQKLALDLNNNQLRYDANYFVNVIHYGANRGASYARNTGYNYSVADWVLFLDDDCIPEQNLLDVYCGALKRHPDAKVLVGMTELPQPMNMWTSMLRVCNVGYFYGVSKSMRHPPWAVTANLLVAGSRLNPTIQFKGCYPKTGGGEDIDFVYQYKQFYPSTGIYVTASVPEAVVRHPWWNRGQVCYKHIMGWAWGDSMCILEWPSKTFLTFPNWVEHVVLVILPLSIYTKKPFFGFVSGGCVILLEHIVKTVRYAPAAFKECSGKGFFHTLLVACGAGTVLSSQEVTRVQAFLQRFSFYSICRRVDWFDGQEPRIKLDIQFGSFIRFAINMGISYTSFGLSPWNKRK